MADFISSIEAHADLPIQEQKQAGQVTGTDMDAKHKAYLATLIAKLDRKEVDVTNPDTFLDQTVYATLDMPARAKVDAALPNVTDQTRRIENFFRSNKTPNASPELQTMIDHLWLMKSRVEEKTGTIFRI